MQYGSPDESNIGPAINNRKALRDGIVYAEALSN